MWKLRQEVLLPSAHGAYMQLSAAELRFKLPSKGSSGDIERLEFLCGKTQRISSGIKMKAEFTFTLSLLETSFHLREQLLKSTLTPAWPPVNSFYHLGF